MQKVDYHIHSNISDGKFSPQSIVEKALQNNCSEISITDHDRIYDYNYLRSMGNINIISGIEFNASMHGLHILGYNLKNINLINEKMMLLEKENELICIQLIKELEKAGYDINIRKIKEFLANNSMPFMYINKKIIVKYLIYKKYFNTVIDAYDKLIGVNQKFYIPIKKKLPEEIINLIKSNNGVAVLAHPITLNKDDDELFLLIKEFKEYGLDGIEIINGGKDSNFEKYIKIADKLDLIKTVGSDFHSMETIGIMIDDEIPKKFHKRLNC